MNGLFQDGNGAPVQDLTAAEFNATFVHEFGHFSGLDHSQVNWECGFGPCGTDNLAGLPTMFPFLVTAQQGTLSIDDIGWISKLYPAGGAGGFNARTARSPAPSTSRTARRTAQLVNVDRTPRRYPRRREREPHDRRERRFRQQVPFLPRQPDQPAGPGTPRAVPQPGSRRTSASTRSRCRPAIT